MVGGSRCGVSSFEAMLGTLVCLLTPATLSALRALNRGRSWQRASGIAVAVALLTAGLMIVAFLMWFEAHRCGE